MRSASEITTNNISILLVEDDDHHAELTLQFLIAGGHQEKLIDRVENLELAIDWFHKHNPSLVILDANLPDARGKSTICGFLGACQDATLIVLTSLNDDALGSFAIAEGAQDFISKEGLTPEHLTRAVRYSLERANAQKKIRELENRSRLALGIAKIGTWEWRLDSNELIWDEHMFNLYRVSPSKFTAAYETWENTVYVDDRARTTAELELAVKNQTKFDTLFRIVWPNEEIRWIRAFGELKAYKGESTTMVGVNWDITREIDATKRLADREAQLQGVLNNSSVMSIATDPTGIVTVFNKKSEELLGYFADEVIGKETPALWHDAEEIKERAVALSEELGRDIQPGFEAFVAKARVAGTDTNDWTLIRKNRSTFPSELTVTVLRDSDNKIQGYLGTLIDLSEKRRNEAELRRSNEELERFAYVASHDLRAPLRHISYFTDILQKELKERSNQNLVEIFDAIQSASSVMRELIDGILSYSKVKGNQEEFEEVDLSDLVRPIIDYLKSTDPEASVEIAALPKVKGQKVLLRQLFQNLIQNGVKYRRKDISPIVSVGYRKIKDAHEFFVKDNGIGIEAEYFDRVFGLFKRLHSKSEHGGSGLGLSICKKVVEVHGGKIWIDSRPGEGATFYFTLGRDRQLEKAIP